MDGIKFFDRWDAQGVKVEDAGLVNYISLNPTMVPKTGARYAGQSFHKSRIPIIERFINKLMIPGHKGKKHKRTSGPLSGKAFKAYELAYESFALIEARTKQNPIAVFVKAIENAAPREEIVSIEYGGARYPKAVECAPQRRIDVALRAMTQGAFDKSFKTKKTAITALADEIIAASTCSSISTAINKKLDLERQADSSR